MTATSTKMADSQLCSLESLPACELRAPWSSERSALNCARRHSAKQHSCHLGHGSIERWFQRKLAIKSESTLHQIWLWLQCHCHLPVHNLCVSPHQGGLGEQVLASPETLRIFQSEHKDAMQIFPRPLYLTTSYMHLHGKDWRDYQCVHANGREHIQQEVASCSPATHWSLGSWTCLYLSPVGQFVGFMFVLWIHLNILHVQDVSRPSKVHKQTLQSRSPRPPPSQHPKWHLSGRKALYFHKQPGQRDPQA